jgi:SAM-dependent methyltransferase
MTMLSARTLEERGSFVLPFLFEGATVLDVGCGPGTITLGFASRVGRSGQVVGVDMQPSQIDLAVAAASTSPCRHVRFQVAEATSLPFAAMSFDVVFAHALFEHVAEPTAVLTEMARVVRPGGVVAICSSDWSGARVEPDSADVRCALQAHFRLRRRAGGEPFAGGRLAEWLEGAGFRLLHVGVENKVDMGYRDLARYVLGRIQDALAGATTAEPYLEEAAAAASRWATREEEGIAVQRWVYALAATG